jgi:ABC-type multidrug transport system permease subunit
MNDWEEGGQAGKRGQAPFAGTALRPTPTRSVRRRTKGVCSLFPSRHHPILSLIAARLREFLREPEAIFWVYVFPLFMVVALGVAFRNRPVEAFRVAVAQGRGAESVRTALATSPRFRAAVGDEQECELRLRTGRADLLIAVSDESRKGGQAPFVRSTQKAVPAKGDCPPFPALEYRFDPTRPESVLARSAADDFLQRAAGRQDVIATRDHEANEPGGRYIDFLVPGLLGMGLMGGGLWGVGYAIVDMRIRKLLKRYLATPMNRSHFLLSVIISRLLFTLPEVALVLVFARAVFGVASAGSYGTIALMIVLGSLEFSGIGLLVPSRAQTIETVSGLMNAVMLPMYIGSGIFFSIERFPDAVQPALQFLPLTPLIHALRSVMLEGASLWSLGVDLALVAVWGGATFVLALRWFRWK